VPHTASADPVSGTSLDPRAERGVGQALRLAVGALRVPVALVGLYADHGAMLVRFEESGVWDSLAGTTLPQALASQVGSAVAGAGARAGGSARGRLSVGSLGLVEYAALPLVVDGRLAGAFAVIDRRQREWGPEQEAMLRDIADVVAREVEWHRERTSGGTAGRHAIETLEAIVARHHGEITVREATASGTRFEVFLPAAGGEPAGDADAEQA
jgi:GAF domain-containing protein